MRVLDKDFNPSLAFSGHIDFQRYIERIYILYRNIFSQMICLQNDLFSTHPIPLISCHGENHFYPAGIPGIEFADYLLSHEHYEAEGIVRGRSYLAPHHSSQKQNCYYSQRDIKTEATFVGQHLSHSSTEKKREHPHGLHC